MSTPTFIDVGVDEQCLDLRTYFKGLGADISDEQCPESLALNLAQIIGVCDACFREAPDADVEAVLNSIVSLLVDVGPAEGEALVGAFCDKLARAPSSRLGLMAVRVLQNLFEALSPDSPLRYDVYCNLVRAAAKTDLILTVFSDLGKLKGWLSALRVPVARTQRLLRLLHEALLECPSSSRGAAGELASRVMVELLSTYTEDNASQARDDAHRCIVSCLADPNSFLLDHLLPLKPVRFLEGELIHDLLTIFVADKLAAYLAFYQANRDFVSSLGLSHEQNLHKMRLLTLLQLAESRRELPFELLQQELQLQDVEAFVVEALRTRLLTAKLDQRGRRLLVGTAAHRTFGRPHWLQLQSSLAQWHARLASVQAAMERVAHYDALAAPPPPASA
ncbi:eukaryotic translation initiation factor 3 subunit m [Haemaphysalis longicornis]